MAFQYAGEQVKFCLSRLEERLKLPSTGCTLLPLLLSYVRNVGMMFLTNPTVPANLPMWLFTNIYKYAYFIIYLPI